MAILKSNGLTLDIRFESFKDEWVNYDIRFLWRDELIVNDNILKRWPVGWKDRKYGTFIANDYQKDDLIEIIKKVLDSNKSECWEPMEPDAKIAIYPGRFFPFVETRYNLFNEMDELRIEDEKQGKPPDLYTIIVFIDEYNFKDSDAYSGDGISLHMIVRRDDLEKFMSDLQMEYDNLMNQGER